MRIIWLGAVAWALFGGLIASNAQGIDAMDYMISALAPVGLLAVAFIANEGGRPKARAAKLPPAGFTRGVGFDHSATGAGRAIRKQEIAPR